MSQNNDQRSRDWKSVAALVATETDPEKMLELAGELIRALDENGVTGSRLVAPESKKGAA